MLDAPKKTARNAGRLPAIGKGTYLSRIVMN
jgi:hypothetical protein